MVWEIKSIFLIMKGCGFTMIKGLLIMLIACSFATAEVTSTQQSFKDFQYYSFSDKSWHNVSSDELFIGKGTNGYIAFIRANNETIPLTIRQYQMILSDRVKEVEATILDIQNNELISKAREHELIGDSINTESLRKTK